RIARIMEEQVRGTDVACRYGGEEFAIILPETSLEEAHVSADRWRQEVPKRFAADFALTVSIGLAACPEHAKKPRALLAAADEALYQAKRAGKNQVRTAGLQTDLVSR